MTRDYFKTIYLEWVNDFLTIETFASYHGLSVDEAKDFVLLAKKVFENNHPEA